MVDSVGADFRSRVFNNEVIFELETQTPIARHHFAGPVDCLDRVGDVESILEVGVPGTFPDASHLKPAIRPARDPAPS
jgi:hypothetical protein